MAVGVVRHLRIHASVVAHRAHDAMTAVTTIVAQTESRPAEIVLIGSDGARVVAAAAAVV